MVARVSGSALRYFALRDCLTARRTEVSRAKAEAECGADPPSQRQTMKTAMMMRTIPLS